MDKYAINCFILVLLFLTATLIACSGSTDADSDTWGPDEYEEYVDSYEEPEEFLTKDDFIGTTWLFSFTIDDTTYNRVYSFTHNINESIVGVDTEKEYVALMWDEANERYVLYDQMEAGYDIVFLFDTFVEGCVSFHRDGTFTDCIYFTAEQVEYFEEI